jgi:hypothetical protein
VLSLYNPCHVFLDCRHALGEGPCFDREVTFDSFGGSHPGTLGRRGLRVGLVAVLGTASGFQASDAGTGHAAPFGAWRP